jgi:hypothetical protein
MTQNNKIDFKIAIGIFLMIISLLGWIIPFAVIPFLHISAQHKALCITAWLIFGQVTYNLGFILVGSLLIIKIRQNKISWKKIKHWLVRNFAK